MALRGYHQDLKVSKFLSGLNATLRSQVSEQMLRGRQYSHIDCHLLGVKRLSTEADVFSAPSIEQFVMISGPAEGRGHVRYFGG